MRTFRLTEEEHKKLLELYQQAERTPMIAMSVKDGLEGKDWATQAWNKVRDFMNELGKKYGYIPETAKISKSTLKFQAEESKVLGGLGG